MHIKNEGATKVYPTRDDHLPYTCWKHAEKEGRLGPVYFPPLGGFGRAKLHHRHLITAEVTSPRSSSWWRKRWS